MKVVLFCGGQGMRLYPTTEATPKPMIHIGKRPILWNLMKYYSFFGHNEFILCLGYKGELIKDYFLNYNEYLNNDFVYSNGGRNLVVLARDISDWNITFADTGQNSNIGQRLKKVEKYLEGEESFLANYSDALTNLHLPDLINFYQSQGKIGCFLSVKPPHTFHIHNSNEEGIVKSFNHVSDSGIRINGGFFVFSNQIFDYIKSGEELVEEPFQRLIDKNELISYQFDGFWANIDTYKDKQKLDELEVKGETFWEVWKKKDNT